MSVSTLLAENPLDRKGHQNGINFYAAHVMAIKDQASGLAAGTLHQVKLETPDQSIINIL